MAAKASISTSEVNCSDDYFDNVCSTCLKKNNRTEGDHYCMEYQAYYCSKCVTFHQDISALSDHKVIGAKDSKFTKKLKGSLKPVPEERYHQHCTAHKKVGCNVCMTLEHTSKSFGTSSLISDQERDIRIDTSIRNMTPQADDSQQRNKLNQQQLIAPLKANGKLPTCSPRSAELMIVDERAVPGTDYRASIYY